LHSIHNMKSCPTCQSEIPDKARFCSVCGTEVNPAAAGLYAPTYPIDFNDFRTLPTQLKEHFLADLRVYLHRELSPAYEGECLKTIYETDFQDLIDETMLELAEHTDRIYEGMRKDSLRLIDQLLAKQFYALLDLLFVRYVPHLLPVMLPDAILQYNDLHREDINLRQMMLDYLDLERERETYYTNIIAIPLKKLEKAMRSFLFYGEREVPIVFCDQTLFGSASEGFCFTDKGFYWKAHFHRPQKIIFNQPFTLERKDNHLLINGHYFNINPALNYKIFKLLIRLEKL